MGIELPRTNQAFSVIRAGQLVQPLINLMRDRLLACDYLQMDESTLQVLKEPGKTAQSKSYIWVQRGGPPDSPLILYDYDPSRSQEVPLRLLEGYQGYLQTDGYSGYDSVGALPGVIQVGCFAHARRKFHDAIKGQHQAGQNSMQNPGQFYTQFNRKVLDSTERRFSQTNQQCTVEIGA